MELCSVDHAARIIGISPATLRNWIKLGLIKPAVSKPLMLSEASLRKLMDNVRSGRVPRLQSRANKTQSAMRTVAASGANSSPQFIASICHILQAMKDHDLAIEPVIFLASMNLLLQKKEAAGMDSSLSTCPYRQVTRWRRRCVQSCMSDWHDSLGDTYEPERYRCIHPLIKPVSGTDFLGVLYQSLLTDGKKARHGSYYTPQPLIDRAFSDAAGDVVRFLDPCCGSGQFLVAAARHFSLQPQEIYGIDSDRLAVQIAKLHLMLAYPEDEFSPRIYCMDALADFTSGSSRCITDLLPGTIDCIVTNPPWGAYSHVSPVSERIASGETFSLFLEKSLTLLRTGGQISFFLPESILNIKMHADIRKLILEETSIRKITKLGRPFPGVFSEVIRLDMTKGVNPRDHAIEIADHTRTYDIQQRRFAHNAHYTFDIAMSRDDEEVIRKIYAAEHDTLKGHALWALGIVTGDNKRFVSDIRRKEMEPVYRGRDLCPYSPGPPSWYITYDPGTFQQAAPEHLYRAPEKLLYRFISSTLVFAYDDRQRLPLNSANMVIPRIPGMNMKAALAFLNSRVFQFLHMKQCTTHKVLRGNLEMFPFPHLDDCTHQAVLDLADQAIREKRSSRELELVIYRSFGLDAQDISIIEASVQRKKASQ